MDEMNKKSEIEVDVRFNEAVPPEQRGIVERSIQNMAEHSVAARDRTRAAEAKIAQLAAAINAPLVKLIEQDSAAIEEFKGLLAQHQVAFESAGILTPDAPTAVEEATLVLRDIRAAVHAPPYHFDWKWHRLDGSPPSISNTNRALGEARLEGRCGPLVTGSGPKFVEAHAGFGLVFRANRDGLLSGDSMRRIVWFFAVGAAGLGSNATSEGGTECTILENGQLKIRDVHRLWRKRVSVGEFDTGNSGGVITDTPMRIQFPMRAGREYTFNVGVWAFADNTSGVGTSATVSGITGVIPSMTVDGI
jgi:hypothetical protein